MNNPQTYNNPVESLSLNGSETWVSQYIPELHNCNLIHLSPSIGNPEYCTIDNIIDYIDRRYRPKEHNHIVFNSESEGFFRLLIDRANQLLDILPDRYDISYSDISYFSGAMATTENTEIFRELVKHPINLYYVSSWTNCGSKVIDHVDSWQSGSADGIEKTKTLLCYNNAPKPHRVQVITQLLHRGLGDCSYISATFDANEVDLEIQEQCFPATFTQTASVFKSIQSDLPRELTISREQFRQRMSAHFEVGLHDYLHHRNSYFSVITESQYFNKHNNEKFRHCEPSYHCAFATEKTYRTIALRHPFVMVSTPGFLKNLRELGYKTFDPFINEEYDLIEDDVERMSTVLNEISRLAAYNRSQWQEWLENVRPIVEHNFQHLKNNCNYAIQA